jgi:hypothetical protein
MKDSIIYWIVKFIFMTTLKITIITILTLGFTSLTYGKAAYRSYPEMIETSEIVAVIDVIEIVPTQTKGSHRNYRQKITAKSLQVLKGQLDQLTTIYGLEDFICAQCHFEKGRQLVFLRRDNDLLAGSNWYLSIRPIIDDKVEWFKDSSSIDLIPMSLDTVLEQVKAEINKQKRNTETDKESSLRNDLPSGLISHQAQPWYAVWACSCV